MKKIICFGDSNTYGYDPNTLRYQRGTIWTDRIQTEQRTIINCGQNGRCIPSDQETNFYSALFKRHMPADAVLILLGTNDILQGKTAEQASKAMEHFLTRIQLPSPILITPVPLCHGEWITGSQMIDESLKLAEQYRHLAEKLNIGFANTADWNIPLTYDGVHFTEKGHEIFASHISLLLDEQNL